jgi:Protein of unknown function (DUF1573)
MKISLRLSLQLFLSLTFPAAAFAQAPVGNGKAPKSKTAYAKSRQRGNDKSSVAPGSGSSDATVPPASARNTTGTPVQSTSTFQAPAIVPVPSATYSTMPGRDPQVDRITGEVIPENLTTIYFEEINHDFGKIKEGETVKYKFRFTNTGTSDLILENVKASCGCTAVDWPKNPIAPGQSGEIETKFNSIGKSGPQMKYITITLNSAEHLERITLSGEVISNPEKHGSPKPRQSH